jgi:hypothetical protein
MKRANIILIACVATVATGCGSSTTNDGGSSGSAGTGGNGGSSQIRGGAAMGGEGGSPGTPALEALSEAPTFAVVSSDFSESSIATLDRDFVILSESWINSGTTYPGLVATLSGDVVLPTLQQSDGTFTFIDRFFTDVVSQFYVPSGNLNGQARTQEPDGDYSSNPHDFVAVSETSAWVTRYEPNLNEDAPPENRGNDLLELDPSTMTQTGNRIDLSEFNTTGTAPGDMGPVELVVYARPDRAVLVGNLLVVGLDRLSLVAEAAGPGVTAIVRVSDSSVEGLTLEDGLQNCGNLTPVPGSPNKVMVGCVGFANPFGDPVQTRASAGFVLLAVDEEGASIDQTWRASTEPSSVIAVNNHVAIDESRVAGIQFGDFGTGTPDQLQLTDIETGGQLLIHESEGPFEIGEPAYDPTTGRIYVPDSGANEVIIYEIAGDEITEIDSIEIAPGIGFAPRSVYYLP